MNEHYQRARQSVLVGIGTVAIAAIALLFLHLNFSLSTKFYAIGMLGVFVVSSYVYYRISDWENRMRRVTAASLHALGVLLILKSSLSQTVQALHVNSDIFIQQSDKATVSAKILLALASTPWPLDVLLCLIGFLMLLGVSVFAKGHRDTQSRGRVAPTRQFSRNAPGVNVNVVQVVGNGSHAVSETGKDEPLPFTAFSTYDSDLPPLIDVWVGRELELELCRSIESGVLAITGIGGQGKSSLGAKILDIRTQRNAEVFWDWRDCREEANRFRTHLLSVIEHFTEGRVQPYMLAGANVTWLTKYLFRELATHEVVIAFDNVDHYADIDQSLFISDVSDFINEALRIEHNALIIFTCRPRISYASSRFREIYLRGLKYEETVSLFAKRIPGGNVNSLRNVIERFHELTDGHPLWLNIIASQIGRKKESADIILKSLESGEMDERANAMLRGVWNSLNDNQRSILRTMAELPRAMDTDSIYDYVTSSVNTRNHFDRAFRGLKAISLITGKGGHDATVSRYELHPMVTAFIRKEYGERGDRKELLDSLIICCSNIVIRLTTKKTAIYSVEVLEQLITKAELQLSRRSYLDAIKTLLDASNSLISRGLHDELFRVSEVVFRDTIWTESDWVEEPAFDSLVRTVTRVMVEQGRADHIQVVLECHTSATNSGTAKYVGVCELNAYVHWFLCEYKEAIKWADRGIQLRKRGGLQTTYDCEHTRALALRDSGQIDEALAIFLNGHDLPAVLTDDHVKSKRGAAFYGNIGRCLFKRGDIQHALILYGKSFDLLEKDTDATSMLNLGYAALWIGEALFASGKIVDAAAFFRLATITWNRRALHKVDIAENQWKACGDDISINSLSEHALREWCREWILDRMKPTTNISN